MASDAWVVQTSTGSRAGPGSTDGPAIPNQNAFQTNHSVDGFIFQNPVVSGFESASEEESADDDTLSESSDEPEQAVVAANNYEVASYFMEPHLSQVHSLATELKEGEKFNQKIPPMFDGSGAYFSYERHVHE